MNSATLTKRLARAEEEIRGLERLIEKKARDVYESQQSLHRSNRFMKRVLQSMGTPMVLVDPAGCIIQCNQAAVTMLGCSGDDLEGIDVSVVAAIPESGDRAVPLLENAEVELLLDDGSRTRTLFSISELLDEAGELMGYVCVWADLREKQELEAEERQAQKLESLGQMAAGVAHEINTPIQFVGDSLTFLRESFEDLVGLVEESQARRAEWGKAAGMEELAQAAEASEEDADVEFIVSEAPGAFERATKGLERVAKIVQALKSFSHPGSEESAPQDINALIETTLTLSHSEYKYVAELETELGEIPSVPCHAGDLGQVVLNLVVNAAHAVGDKMEGTGELGKIFIRTRLEDDFVAIEVQDTGVGIPEDIVHRIFDPFFTTKEVGKGTGQGLAISHRIVVEKHRGRLEVTPDPGKGSTFRVLLPVDAQAVAPAAA